MERQPDEGTHQDHAADRSDAEDEDIRHTYHWGWDRREDEKHQRTASGETVHQAYRDRACGQV